ncbi:MAG TPA: hypothetical protein VM912_10260 [Terriglobales bacterium]|nr:hypothetical protein [Terriglobales bacterium]
MWREICNYLEDEIGAGLRTRMDEPFKGCKRCTAVLVGTRNVVRLVGDAAIFDFLSATSDRLDQKLDPELPGVADPDRKNDTARTSSTRDMPRGRSLGKSYKAGDIDFPRQRNLLTNVRIMSDSTEELRDQEYRATKGKAEDNESADGLLCQR